MRSGITRPPGVAAGVAALMLLALLLAPGQAAAASGDRPNVVVITTDDQTLAQMNEDVMPFTSWLFAEHGSTFENAITVSPSCCPSRAAFLSGQYPHNNGVFANRPGYSKLREKRNTLPVWLKRAGYRTAHLGKYLHRYGEAKGWRNPAPGWSTWYTLAGTYRYFNYRIAKNGSGKHYGERPRDYITRRLNRKATRFIARSAAGKRPFYLQLDHFAPHSEVGSTPGRCPEAAQPDPTDLDLFTDAPLPQRDLDRDERSFNEEDVSDKSPALAQRRYLSDFVISKIERRWRCQLAALAGIDRGVQAIYRQLRRAGAMKDTAIFFTSDNGFFHGEHRLPNNKGFPYEEGIRVPLLVRLPPGQGPQPDLISEPVANIDLTASIVELTGAEPCNKRACRRLDGRSLLELLSADGDASWPEQRTLLVEQGRIQFFCAPYTATWTPERLYVEYPTRIGSDEGCAIETEHYEMDSDPLQLENLYPADPGTARRARQSAISSELGALRRCTGIEGREPPKRRRPYCE